MSQWALIGKLGEAYTEKSKEMLSLRSPYDLKEEGGYLYFKTSYDFKKEVKPIRLSNRIYIKNYKNSAHYNLFNYSNPRYQTSPSRLVNPNAQEIFEIFNKYNEFQLYEKIAKVIFYASNDQLPKVFTDIVAPYFFNMYPKGEIYLVSTELSIQTKLAALRVMGSLDNVAGRDINKIQEFTNFLTLEGAQSSGMLTPIKYLSIPLAMSLPKPIGFHVSRVIDGAIFLFDKTLDDVRKPFPKSALDYFRSSASNILNEDIDAYDESGKFLPDRIDTFQLINIDFSQKEWEGFIKQYLKKLNDFIIYMTDPANFTNKEGEWVGITQYLVWLIFERLCDEVILLLTEENHYLRKMSLFRILDQLAFLADKDIRTQTIIFKNYLLPNNNDVISANLSKYKLSIGSYLNSKLESTRDNLIKTVTNSITYKDSIDSTNRLIKLPDGNIEDYEEYSRNVVRQLRNTAHGYSDNKYLMINNGNLPDDLPLLGILVFFAFIANPKDFLRPLWN